MRRRKNITSGGKLDDWKHVSFGRIVLQYFNLLESTGRFFFFFFFFLLQIIDRIQTKERRKKKRTQWEGFQKYNKKCVKGDRVATNEEKQFEKKTKKTKMGRRLIKLIRVITTICKILLHNNSKS